MFPASAPLPVEEGHGYDACTVCSTTARVPPGGLDLEKGSKFEKSHHRIITRNHIQSYTLCFPQKGVHFIRIEHILQQKPSLIWVTFLWQDECEMLKEERPVVKRVDGEEENGQAESVP